MTYLQTSLENIFATVDKKVYTSTVGYDPIYATPFEYVPTVERIDTYADVHMLKHYITIAERFFKPIITNNRTEEETPDTPDTPPETPGTPDTPEGPGPETPEEGQVLGASRPRESGAVLGANRPRVLGARRVKTGDESTMLANGAAAAGAMGAAGLWAALRRKFSRRKRDDD